MLATPELTVIFHSPSAKWLVPNGTARQLEGMTAGSAEVWDANKQKVDEDDKNEDMQVLARRLWERRARAMGLQLDNKEDQPSRQEPQGAS